ncbi:hypothetical protein HDU82_008944, partial [Entophlyctis luteolus]
MVAHLSSYGFNSLFAASSESGASGSSCEMDPGILFIDKNISANLLSLFFAAKISMMSGLFQLPQLEVESFWFAAEALRTPYSFVPSYAGGAGLKHPSGGICGQRTLHLDDQNRPFWIQGKNMDFSGKDGLKFWLSDIHLLAGHSLFDFDDQVWYTAGKSLCIKLPRSQATRPSVLKKASLEAQSANLRPQATCTYMTGARRFARRCLPCYTALVLFSAMFTIVLFGATSRILVHTYSDGDNASVDVVLLPTSQIDSRVPHSTTGITTTVREQKIVTTGSNAITRNHKAADVDLTTGSHKNNKAKSNLKIASKVLDFHFTEDTEEYKYVFNSNNTDTRLRNITAARIRDLIRCSEAGNCTKMQQTVVILGMPPFRDSLLGQVSGEATWAGSIHSSMNALGYTALPSDSLEETLLYRIVGNLTTLVLLDSWQIDECWVRRFNRDFRCLLTEWHQSGIPVWKMVAAIIWPGCIHPVRLTSHIATDISLFQLGYEWCFSRENYRAWIPNQLPTYIGCSIEEYCTSVPYIPWKNRTNTVFIFAKHMEHFSNMKTSHEIFRTLSSNSRGSNRIEFVAPMNDPSSSVSNVQNVGRFSRFEFLKKVGESKVMLGIGNPSTSLSPYEALCMGTVFFNPISSYDKDDRNNRHLWNTQYDGLKYLNPPFVYNYFADDDSKLVELLELAITQEVPGRFIPEYMKRSSVTKRMMSFVNINWKSKALMEKAIRSKFGGE